LRREGGEEREFENHKVHFVLSNNVRKPVLEVTNTSIEFLLDSRYAFVKRTNRQSTICHLRALQAWIFHIRDDSADHLITIASERLFRRVGGASEEKRGGT
jgi:hypothetical protein